MVVSQSSNYIILNNISIIDMNNNLDDQINVLCIGDILCGKSNFLQNYTHSTPENLHYRVYPKTYNQHSTVFFHEVKERFGMDAYFTYPFDAILYFLNIHDYHNPQYAIIQQLLQISKLNGTNIFKMPLKVIVLSSKTDYFSSIKQFEKENLKKQLVGMVQESMIIFVENNQNHEKALIKFYEQITSGEAKGIEESFYVNWQLKGVQGLVPVENIILTFKKICETIKKQCKKLKFLKLFGYKQYQHKEQ